MWKMTYNQRTVLLHFNRTGILTLAELRKTSRYWNQSIKVLVHQGLVDRTNDGRYALTRQGGDTIALIQRLAPH